MTALPHQAGTTQASPTLQIQASAEELLELIAAGDAFSFAQLYEMFASRVYTGAHRVLRDPAQAEEVSQEVFIEIWSGATKFDRTRGSATSWIMTLAHREAIDRVRHSQRSRERDHLHAAADYERDHDNVQDQVHYNLNQSANKSQVEQIMRRLTPLQQQVIRLAFYNNYSYRTISELLGIPLPTVKTRVRDSLIRIRKHMEVELVATTVTNGHTGFDVTTPGSAA